MIFGKGTDSLHELKKNNKVFEWNRKQEQTFETTGMTMFGTHAGVPREKFKIGKKMAMEMVIPCLLDNANTVLMLRLLRDCSKISEVQLMKIIPELRRLRSATTDTRARNKHMFN